MSSGLNEVIVETCEFFKADGLSIKGAYDCSAAGSPQIDSKETLIFLHW